LDGTDEKILELMKGNARISYQKLGEELGMSRVAARKRVQKLKAEGIIRGYNTCIYNGQVTFEYDIYTLPDKLEEVLAYLTKRTAYIRQIFTTNRANHIHVVAVSDSYDNLNYLSRMIMKGCGKLIDDIQVFAVRNVIKDVYGGIGNEQRTGSDNDGSNEQPGGSDTQGEARGELQVSNVHDEGDAECADRGAGSQGETV